MGQTRETESRQWAVASRQEASGGHSPMPLIPADWQLPTADWFLPTADYLAISNPYVRE
jgi:hypothetical protein